MDGQPMACPLVIALNPANRRPSGRRPDTSAERSPVTERGIGQAKKLPWGFVDSHPGI